MLARQESVSKHEEKIQNIKRGLDLAKEAVQLDAQDGLSWAVLGNAHLSSFFGIEQNPKTLKSCMSAYNQAVSLFIHFLRYIYIVFIFLLYTSFLSVY